MNRLAKIRRAKAIYGIVIDEKTLTEILSKDPRFAKSLLIDSEYTVYDYMIDNSEFLSWNQVETTENSYIYVIGKSFTEMKEDQTFKEFKKEVVDMISTLIKVEFFCSVISIPKGEY